MKSNPALVKIDYYTRRLEETLDGLDEFHTHLYLHKLNLPDGMSQHDVANDLQLLKIHLDCLREAVDKDLNRKSFWQKLLRK